MQSASDLPPPPGLLGADSLGLEVEVAGDRARLGEPPPPVANWVGTGSDMGERAGSAGSGVAGAAGPVAAGRGAAGVGGAGTAAAGEVATALVLLVTTVVAADAPRAAVTPAGAATPPAPWLRAEAAMPEPRPPEERASADGIKREDTRRAAAGMGSAKRRRDLGVSMLTPLTLSKLELYKR
jgi:hypothetical protein